MAPSSPKAGAQNMTPSNKHYQLDVNERVVGLTKTPGYGVSLEPYNLDEKIKLVPDRWSHTGWKYVGDEPSNHKFFANPNRVNSFGRP